MQSAPRFQYLNTDLDLVGPASLGPLISHFESMGVSALSPTREREEDQGWSATFETDSSFEEPDPNIAALLRAIESMPGAARDCWNACTLREFNVGYDCGEEPWAFSQGLTNETLRRMATAGATFRVTLYPGGRG